MGEKLSKYHLIPHCHSVFEFGNSQKSRKRLILVGIRHDSRVDYHHFERLFKVSEPFLVKDIGKMINNDLNFREDDDKN